MRDTTMRHVLIHVCDWNLEDRLIKVPLSEATSILTDITRTATERMQAVYDLAVKQGKTNSNPRVKSLGSADIFLGWPGKGTAFVADENWDKEHADDLAALVAMNQG